MIIYIYVNTDSQRKSENSRHRIVFMKLFLKEHVSLYRLILAMYCSSWL